MAIHRHQRNLGFGEWGESVEINGERGLFTSSDSCGDKRQHRSWEMVLQIKMPAAKSNEMSSTLRTHVVEGKNQLSDHHTSTRVCMYIDEHVHTHTHKICIHVYVCKIRKCGYVWDAIAKYKD